MQCSQSSVHQQQHADADVQLKSKILQEKLAAITQEGDGATSDANIVASVAASLVNGQGSGQASLYRTCYRYD